VRKYQTSESKVCMSSSALNLAKLLLKSVRFWNLLCEKKQLAEFNHKIDFPSFNLE